MVEGGLYIPPYRRRALELSGGLEGDSRDLDVQRKSWEKLKKGIKALINKVNVSNIAQIIVELFRQNLLRGRGIFCRSLLRAQLSSPEYTAVYASLACVVNSKMPETGWILLNRLLHQLHRGLRRRDKKITMATTKFVAHLFNQQVCDELLPLQIITLMIESPTDDSVQVAADFLKEVGAFLSDISPRALEATFAMLRAVLHDGSVSPRAQYKIEELFTARRRKFSDFVTIPAELDLVEDDDKIVHNIAIDSYFDVCKELDVFKFDKDFELHEKEYDDIRAELLGDDQSSREESDAEEPASEKLDDTEKNGSGGPERAPSDMTEAELTHFRRQVYLTIMSAIGYEEAAHKLVGLMKKSSGREKELCEMLIECCSQEKTFLTYYALIGRRFCSLNQAYVERFEEAFALHYATIHRFETRKIRNIGSFYAALLSTESLPWSVFQIVRLIEEETTSSSRIFLKVIFQELAKGMSVKALRKFLQREDLKHYCEGLFPKDKAENTRFAINYFTSIGLGLLTDELREYLANMPEGPLRKSVGEGSAEDSSSSLTSSSLTSSSSTLSESSADQDHGGKRRRIDYSTSRRKAKETDSDNNMTSKRGDELDAKYPVSMVGRGRGRSLTRPAWMATAEKIENAGSSMPSRGRGRGSVNEYHIRRTRSRKRSTR